MGRNGANQNAVCDGEAGDQQREDDLNINVQTRILIRIVSHRLHLLGLDIVFEIHQWKVDDTYCNVLVVF